MSLSRNVTDRDFQRHGPATEKLLSRLPIMPWRSLTNRNGCIKFKAGELYRLSVAGVGLTPLEIKVISGKQLYSFQFRLGGLFMLAASATSGKRNM